MNIGLLLHRATDLKWAGPLGKRAIEKGHALTLLAFEEADRPNQAKRYLNVTPQHCRPLTALGAEYAPLRADKLLEDKALESQDALLMQEGPHAQREHLDKWQLLRQSGLALYSLSHFFEVCQRPLSTLASFDGTVYISDYARRLHHSLHGEASDQRADQFVGGSPMFDQFRGMTRSKSRQALGLSDERIVLLIAPVILPTTPWRFHVWRDQTKLSRARDAMKVGRFGDLAEILFGHTFRDVFAALREFCDRSQAKLIVKSRGKQNDSPFVAAGADQFVDGFDDEFFPQFSTYTLMAAADLCIAVNSMAGLEAVALGTPVINIHVPPIDQAFPLSEPRRSYYKELLGGAPQSLMNYPGAVKQVDRRQATRFFAGNWQELCFEPSSAKDYAREFLGLDKRDSSSRILDWIEARSN